MLKKIQKEKDRANDLRLSDAFFITKYGPRFNIDCKVVKHDWNIFSFHLLPTNLDIMQTQSHFVDK